MGIIFEKYRSGINLGGWLSQWQVEGEELVQHIDNFITHDDIMRIASWGLDHVRLPFDYPLLERNGNIVEAGFAAIDKAVEWCMRSRLGIVIDMHKAPGYSFINDHDQNDLFTNISSQDRFVRIWQALAERYKGIGSDIIFELLNETRDPKGPAWNQLIRRTIDAIHDIDVMRYIMIGGPHYNSVQGLSYLEIYDDPMILYNFHFYDPMYVTHQRAWWNELANTGVAQPYPGKIAGVKYLQETFDKLGKPPWYPVGELGESAFFDIHYLEGAMSPAIEFSQRHNKELYCGEYGCIGLAGLENRINYIRDVNQLFEKYKIGRSLWTYKGMNFTSLGKNDRPVSPEYLRAIQFE